ncbi:MAG: alpha/beta fold hydrolase [Chloroflexota bacterium]
MESTLSHDARRSSVIFRAGRRSKPGRALAVAGLGLAGLVFGGFPYWAARRVMYPAFEEAMPRGANLPLSIELNSNAVPEYVVYSGHNGMERSGWFVPGADTAEKPWPTILLLYGYGGHKEQMAYYARLLHDAGFACFMFDMHGSGLLRGLPVTMGYTERWDTLDAVAYLGTRSDVDSDRIGALGVSMGAATALMAAELEPKIKAVVSDSSYADLNDMVQPGLRTFVGRPATFFAPLIMRWAEQMVGMKAGAVHPEASAGKLGQRPLFVIHGADDQLTDPNSAPRIFAAASGPKELWVVPDCGHARAPEVAHEEYKERVTAFFRGALLGK